MPNSSVAESTELESESLRIAPLSKRAQALPGLLSKCWPMSGHQLIVYDLSFFERLETKRPTALCGFVLAEHLGVKPNQPLGCTA